MLDCAKVVRELELVADRLFLDISSELELARSVWDLLAEDQNFREKIEQASSPWPLPLWDGYLKETISLEPFPDSYYALGIDGSQIYPDKHQGTSCFLINVGIVLLPYKNACARRFFSSEPYLFVERDFTFDEEVSAIDLVNCKREEFELRAAVEQIAELKSTLATMPLVFLFDGSLIFWHLESKGPLVKDYFLRSYCSLLGELKKEHIPLAGYISLPKSKELINLVRAGLCNFVWSRKEHEKIAHVNDAHIVSSFVRPGERTLLFQSQSPITHFYPDDLRPYFFYLNAGAEIARVELPAYVAHDSHLLHQVCAVIMDQINKGRGYPIVVAEAHEQAVVKGPDRELFYRLLEKFSIRAQRHVILSQKALKKKNVTV